jgi:hypothetical protein
VPATATRVTGERVFLVVPIRRSTPAGRHEKGRHERMGILWIILIVILVLALLGFFSRGYW